MTYADTQVLAFSVIEAMSTESVAGEELTRRIQELLASDLSSAVVVALASHAVTFAHLLSTAEGRPLQETLDDYRRARLLQRLDDEIGDES